MNTSHPSFAVPQYSDDGVITVPAQKLLLPETLSEQAASWMSGLYRQRGKIVSDASDADERARVLTMGDTGEEYITAVRAQFLDGQNKLLDARAVSVERQRIEQIPVDVVVPNADAGEVSRARVVLHLNNAGYLGFHSLTSAIWIATLLGVRVVVPYLSELPGDTRIDALERLLLVYRALSDEQVPGSVGLSGEGCGAALCTSLVVLAYQNSVPGPGAMALFGIAGLEGEWSHQNRYLDVTDLGAAANDLNGDTPHTGTDNSAEDPYDPVLFPINANMEMFPPSILFSGTRDVHFDSTVIFHREMKRAKCVAQLHIFDGLPQAFQMHAILPEAREAFEQLAYFFDSALTGTPSIGQRRPDRGGTDMPATMSDAFEDYLLLPPRAIKHSEHISRDAKAYLHSMFTHYVSQFGREAKPKAADEIREDFVSKMRSVSAVKNELAATQFQVEIEEMYVGETKVDVVHAPQVGSNAHRCLMYFCGGVDFLGNQQVYVALQLASMLNIEIYVPRYRAVPASSLAEQDEDVLNAYQLARQSYSPACIGVFGESSGATVTTRLLDLCAMNQLPTPGAIGLLGIGGLRGDAECLNKFLDPMAVQANIVHAALASESAGKRRESGKPDDDYAAYMSNRTLGELGGFPPAMLVTGTRDQLLSSTSDFHRRLVRAGVHAELNVYEGMPHSHHAISHLPEAEEALEELAEFFERTLG